MTEGGTGTGGGDPSKSASSGTGEDGLLGGSTGGLLDPPQSGGTTSPSAGTPSTDPDVTIPPLLPGLLPGLGIDSEDAD